MRETGLLVGRGLRTIPRVPSRLSDVTIQPVVFTLLFLYVFGSAIHITGISYQNYLLPGLIGQSLAFGVIGAGVATASDFTSGVVDRFRSLPVTRLSVISAQVIGQILEQILGMVIVAAIGIGLGWRPHLTIATGFELVGSTPLGPHGVHVVWGAHGDGRQEFRRHAGHRFRDCLPLSFLAGAFVPIAGMKLVPRVIGEWDPLSSLVASVRYVTQGTHSTGSWQLTHPVISMIFWCLLIIAICVPLALRRFRTTTAA